MRDEAAYGAVVGEGRGELDFRKKKKQTCVDKVRIKISWTKWHDIVIWTDDGNNRHLTQVVLLSLWFVAFCNKSSP